MPRDNICVYMVHVFLNVCCSDCAEFCGNVCCAAGIVDDSVLNHGVLKHVICLCRGCDESSEIVRRGVVCARVWEV